MSKIEFNIENWDKCVCNRCPTQADSECVKEKKMRAMEMMPKIKENDASTRNGTRSIALQKKHMP